MAAEDEGSEGPEDESIQDDEAGDELDPAAWGGVPDVCGSCIAFKPDAPRPDESVAAGSCKLRPEIGRIKASLRKCSSYLPRGRFTYTPGTVRTPTRRRAKTLSVIRHAPDGTEIRTERKIRAPRASAPPSDAALPSSSDGAPSGASAPARFVPPPPPRIVERPPRPPAPKTIDLGEGESLPVVRQALVELIRQELGRTRRELHAKYKRGGVVVAESAGGERKVEVRAERFFASLDRLQSALASLEKALDAKKGALGEDAAEMKEALRAMRGSFTTFNVLFDDRADYFSSKD